MRQASVGQVDFRSESSSCDLHALARDRADIRLMQQDGFQEELSQLACALVILFAAVLGAAVFVQIRLFSVADLLPSPVLLFLPIRPSPRQLGYASATGKRRGREAWSGN